MMNNEEKKDVKNNSEVEVAIMKAKLERGVISVNSAFDNKLSGEVLSLIDYLVYVKNRKDILIEINSPGGVITDGLAIYDKIRSVEPVCKVHTVVTGMAASMGAALLCMGTSGCRYAYPNSTIMIHQPLSGYGVRTKVSDLKRSVEKMLGIKEKLLSIMAKTSNISYEEMVVECDRDNYMSAEEALKMGLIDSIMTDMPKEFLL